MITKKHFCQNESSYLFSSHIINDEEIKSDDSLEVQWKIKNCSC